MERAFERLFRYGRASHDRAIARRSMATHALHLILATTALLLPGVAYAQNTAADDAVPAANAPPVGTPPTGSDDRSFDTPGVLLAARLGTLVMLGDAGQFGQLKPGLAISATAGFFPIAQLGVFVGYRTSVLHPFHSDTVCGGQVSQFPLVLEYAPEGRGHGLFVDGGVGLFNSARLDPCYSVDVAQTYRNPVTAKVAIGYRQAATKTSRWGLEARTGVDIGSFSTFQYGDRPSSSDHAFYNVFDLTVGIYLIP